MRRSIAKRWRTGIILLGCILLAGCATMIAPYPQQWQSVEAVVQTVLVAQGYYDGPVDGIVGPATRRSIRNYQRDYQLTPTGTINAPLLASMGLAAPESVNVVVSGYPFFPWGGGPGLGGPPPAIGIGWGGGPPAGGWGGPPGGGWGGGGPGGRPGGGGNWGGGGPPGGGGGPPGGGGGPSGGGGRGPGGPPGR